MKKKSIDKIKSFISTGWVKKPVKTKYKRREPYYGRGQGRGLGMGAGRGGHLNSPSLAYKAIHGKEPKQYLPGKSAHPQKLWNGIPVDKELKTKWIKNLNNMKNIEMRGSCAGHGPDRTSYVVFRLKPGKDKYAKKVANHLNKIPGIYSIADIGGEGRPRIVAASKTYYGKKDWEKWWDKIPDRIDSSVSNVEGVKK
jgi:hypothetical protein